MSGNETRRIMMLGLWNKKGFSQRMNLSTVVAPSDLWPWPHLVISHLISGSLVHNCVWENLNECHLGDPGYDLVCQGNERQAHRSLPWLWDGVSAEALCTTDGPRHGSPTWLWDYKPYHNNITSYFAIKTWHHTYHTTYSMSCIQGFQKFPLSLPLKLITGNAPELPEVPTIPHPTTQGQHSLKSGKVDHFDDFFPEA